MIRVAAYNVSGGQEPGPLSEVLLALRPDVACLVETPPRLALRRLARRAGMDVAVRAGRRRAGVAVLTGDRVRVVSQDRFVLSEVAGSPERSVAQAILGSGSLRLTAFAVQFGLRPEVREQHRTELEAILARVDTPVVLGADLNEVAGGPTCVRLGEVLADAFAVAGEGAGQTFPTPEPIARKDFVFVGPGLAVLRAWVADAPPAPTAAHHLPVVAEIAATDERPTDRSTGLEVPVDGADEESAA